MFVYILLLEKSVHYFHFAKNKITLFLIIGIDPFTEHASISFAIVVACTYIKIFH